ncbi:hypothetical protein [Arthrobacter sp. GMC3]|uniref:hypothetical protein n=1 Tax=Arthrobacter sp. GMC3 TaxID=2058894 RepID=UPI0011B031B1|nr:hypothetical protein [Arthrobacter sp. GMC3]
MFSSQQAVARHSATRMLALSEQHSSAPIAALCVTDAGFLVPPLQSAHRGRAPYSESATDKPSETKAFPQPSSTPSKCSGTNLRALP